VARGDFGFTSDVKIRTSSRESLYENYLSERYVRCSPFKRFTSDRIKKRFDRNRAIKIKLRPITLERRGKIRRPGDGAKRKILTREGIFVAVKKRFNNE